MFKPKLLITGVSGFIGQALVDDLHKDFTTYGFYETYDNMIYKNPQIDTKNKYMVDLRDDKLINQLVKMIQPHYVIHLAARSEVANSFDNYLEVADINYRGTVALAEANRRFNPGMQLFVMASTMETYGDQRFQKPFDESTLQNPMAPYAVAKVASENYLRYMSYAYSFPSTILRQTNTYGRVDNNFFVVERIISQFYTDFDHVCLGNPEPMRNFLFIDDLVSLYRTILLGAELQTVSGQTFVTGPDNAVTIRELAHQIAVKFGFTGSDVEDLFKWHTQPARPGEIYYLSSVPAKAKHLLGWEPKVSLSKGLDRTIEMMRLQDKRTPREDR